MKSRFVLSTVMGLDLFFSANEDSIVYKLGGCFVESCNVAYCGHHLLGKLQSCDVCYKKTAANISLVGEGFAEPSTFYLCQAHATRCDKKLSGSQASDEPVDNTDEDGDEICNFVCCPSCVLSHQCGYDPTDYV